MTPRLLQEDLDHVLAHCETLWPDFDGAHLFITGATGFFGKWLLETLLYANDQKTLGLRITGLSRNPTAFLSEMPHLAEHPALAWHTGDVKNFTFPVGKFTHIIHAATEASAKLNEEHPLTMFDTIVSGTRHTLDFAVASGIKDFLLISSGAVYGRQPAKLSNIDEDYRGGPDTTDSNSAYAEGKRAAETLCAIYAREYGISPRIARCFAFIGPHLPLDAHFAAGNFIRDALSGGPITLKGDGQSVRSYLYTADLVVWLLTILMRAKPPRTYNVGSDHAITTLQLAKHIAEIHEKPLDISLPTTTELPADRYVPEISRSRKDLGLNVLVTTDRAVRRMMAWYSRKD